MLGDGARWYTRLCVALLSASRVQCNEIAVSRCRADRCGAVIQDMLYAHAWAAHSSQVYGGCCRRVHDCRSLLSVLNLSAVLNQDVDCSNATTVPSTTYRKELRYFTLSWLTHIRSFQVTIRPKQQHTIVAHVRRGDVSIKTPKRYLPNSYYISKIEERRLSSSRVIIFTEFAPGLDDFYQRNYTVSFTPNLSVIWSTILNADVFIMSRSSFSYVPALFSRGIVVYSPFWHQALPWWTS